MEPDGSMMDLVEECMTLIPAFLRESLAALTNVFFSKPCTHIGVEQMQSDTNTSQTATTSSDEKTENLRSYHLRHIYDGITYPALNLRVCLSGPPEDRWGYALWLGRAGCRFVDDPLEADFVIFTGGADVSPRLYDEPAIAETYASPSRDEEDLALYETCLLNGIPMVGICRGAQFLWTRKGGKLYQDVDNHNNGEHEIYVFGENKKYLATSVHHQMVRTEALPGFKLLANATASKTRKTSTYIHTGPSSDFEIYAFPDDCILGIQGHPEYPGYPNYSELCLRLIDQYIYDNPKTIYKSGKLRIASIVNAPAKQIVEVENGE